MTDPRPEAMDCDEVEALLPLVADQTLTPEDDPSLFDHLAHCPDCQRSLASYDLIDLALQAGSNKPAAADKQAEVITFYRLPWLAAAGWVLAAGGLGFGAWLANDHFANSQAEVSLANEPAQVIEQHSAPGAPDNGNYLIRVGHEVYQTDATDGVDPELAPANADKDRDSHHVPVHQRRY